MSKIVIGYDGSDQAEDALALGGTMVEALGAEPLVVTVLPLPPHLLDQGDMKAAVAAESEVHADRAREHLGLTEVETRVPIDTSPARGLEEVAEVEEPAAIVVGSSHRSPVGRILLGSVAESLLSGAPSAVAVSPRGYAERERRELLRIGVAVDDSPESMAAVDVAVDIARRSGARLEVLSVVTATPFGYGPMFEELNAGEYLSAQRTATERAIRAAQERLPDELPADHRIMEGDNPARVITEAAEDLDLLVLGSRGYGPVRRALLGSVSARVMRSAPCPALVVPRGAETE